MAKTITATMTDGRTLTAVENFRDKLRAEEVLGLAGLEMGKNLIYFGAACAWSAFWRTGQVDPSYTVEQFIDELEEIRSDATGAAVDPTRAVPTTTG